MLFDLSSIVIVYMGDTTKFPHCRAYQSAQEHLYFFFPPLIFLNLTKEEKKKKKTVHVMLQHLTFIVILLPGSYPDYLNVFCLLPYQIILVVVSRLLFRRFDLEVEE